ncbi:Uncharacterised protein [Niallia circulans]|jgi:hypothetical protein|uniref:hypothetical protein n=1 Tax=Niallia circulans TaxID=1397 RepID=UPI00077CA49C|nr:hypothetical protein [Niallia circulans]MDR4315037.1 hypothetical protein [Niallia circulans]MED3839769.1 hypothetical protein [Niallia circulans]MED4241255.1 hypothetical protein [Niallia circulans]MED4247916.1 hypothetical protein [Niallia circulans]QKH61605.1 hypothetical protein FOC77_13585 [Niallia circulans]
MSNYNVQESVELQKRLCEEKGYPHFAPRSGVCWNCHKNIYEPIEQKRIMFFEDGKPEKTIVTGITVDKAANQLVTGCPHCNRTYCD